MNTIFRFCERRISEICSAAYSRVGISFGLPSMKSLRLKCTPRYEPPFAFLFPF